jgi:magnesium transporter
MLTVYTGDGSHLSRIPCEAGATPPREAVWLDLLNPTPEEAAQVAQCVGVELPSREDMAEIEISSRLYVEDGARFMTATLVCSADTAPHLTNVTFILRDKRLVTVRYDEPRPFAAFANRSLKALPGADHGVAVLLGLLEAIIDRAADVLERLGADIDGTASGVLSPPRPRGRPSTDYQAILRTLGRKADLLSKSRESLVTIGRVVSFLGADFNGQKLPKEALSQLQSMTKDSQALSDHASYLGEKVQFLLDATVGMVSIEQNDIIKLFSVVAVVMMPPTLIASIYGMNFKGIPELSWSFGYPYALCAMVVSAVLPYLFFRWKKLL